MSHGHRRSLRLKGHSYIEGGAYFITVCTYWRRCILGEIRDDEMHLNDLGVAVAQAWRATPDHFPLVQNDAFVVMPNHIHGLLLIGHGVGAKHASPLHHPPRGALSGSVPAIVQSFKSAATRSAHLSGIVHEDGIWQRGFHDRVVRNEGELNRIRAYIDENPLRWSLDRENPLRLSP